MAHLGTLVSLNNCFFQPLFTFHSYSAMDNLRRLRPATRNCPITAPPQTRQLWPAVPRQRSGTVPLEIRRHVSSFQYCPSELLLGLGSITCVPYISFKIKH